MKKKVLIGAVLMALAAFPGAVSYRNPCESKVGDASQQAIEETRKEEMVMKREQNAVLRKVEFENNRVAVVRFRFGPHAEIPLHAVPDLVAVWLTDARLRLTFPDGTNKVEDHKAGDVAWEPAQKHSGENMGDAPLEFISIQLKGEANVSQHEKN
jgi:quercetin dioxygenase-like cupin family protein